jgi:hypothetical protein
MKNIVKYLTSLLLLTMSIALAQQVDITNPVAPKTQLTTNWVFVVDTSHSMQGVFDKSRAAFLHATSHPTDELFFSVITFNDRGMERFRDWQPASDRAFREASRWIETEMRVLSYGQRALEMALHLARPELTIVLITDGGFTEASEGRGFEAIRRTITSGQEWRRNNGHGSALLCAIGIENIGYTTGGKPSDADCQAFLREVGDQHGGGYFLVRNAMPEARTRR